MTETTIDRDKLRDIYTRTMRVARADEKFRSLLMTGKLAVIYYTVRGQELVSAAAMAALEPGDYLVTTYRGQHDQIAKGVPLNPLFAEIAGKVGGTCRGKGGSMHITHPETGVMVTTGVVGSGLPIANGLALASQNRGDGKVTMVCFGDGATDLPPSEWSKIDDILDDEGDIECRARSIARKRLSASYVRRRLCLRRALRPPRRVVGSRSASRPIIGGARNMAA